MSTAVDIARHDQRRGADPANSAFVMANAGSGKTRVLTERVARMLLNRVDPQQILCITFTKAAAAEMSERLFKTLGEWALADSDKLRKDLAEIEGDDGPVRDEAALSQVRRLFARALETPGGLKIQTIHAFCEGMLRRFPLEAGVAPGFTVIEDVEAQGLIASAIDNMARRLDENPAQREDLTRLSLGAAEPDLRAMLTRGVSSGLKLNAVFERYGGLDDVLREMRRTLGVVDQAMEELVNDNFVTAFDQRSAESLRDALLDGGKTARETHAGAIADYLAASAIDEKWSALSALFLTSEGAPRKRLGDKAVFKAHPWAEPRLRELQEAFVDAHEQLKAIAVYEDSAAYHRLVAALREDYDRAKAARAMLDFDDLILHARTLLQKESAAWVRYKMDFGIDHILVDETQDTSPEQWSVIRALLDDYLSGESARAMEHTFFAVGDVKQSIYSFQGANADVFEEQETTLGKTLAAYHSRTAGEYAKIDMQMSFRTTAPVLEFVDAVFSDREAQVGLGKDGAPPHLVHRVGQGGLVEIWPLAPRREIEKANAWDAPVDAPVPDHPVERLSQRVARTIGDWVKSGEKLASCGRPITADDVLVLVQSRGTLFNGVLRALAAEGVPVAGADRLKLLEDPAVEDLLSYMKFCVQSRDDLSLAEVLKSPLFEFDDDTDLFPLGFERGECESLWASLRRRHNERDTWRAAYNKIAAVRSIGQRGGVYAFLTRVLETGQIDENLSGRARFNRRLSAASRDAIDEMLRHALEFERGHPRSLRAFIDWFEDKASEVKREMERSDNAVRVMTVHGAKGLEANIVFLIDAHRYPLARKAGAPLELVGDDAATPRTGRLSVIAGAKERDCAATENARIRAREKQFEEYRRLFYVAATRARDRLYVAGIESGNERDPRAKPTLEKSWHSLALDAFDALGVRITQDDAPFWDGAEAPARRLFLEQTAPVKTGAATTKPQSIELPDWLSKPARPELTPRQISPSRLAEEEEADTVQVVANAPAYSPIMRDRYFRGRILHRMLELLPDIEREGRLKAADSLLVKLAANISVDERNEWRDEVLAVLDHPDFVRVFDTGSRPEVSVAGEIHGNIVSGQIDRLAIDGDEICIVDFKTNRPPPKRVEDTAPAYLAQMAAYRALLQKIYPGHQVECALLWTFAPRLSPLPKLLLDEAYDRWVATG